MLQFHERAEVSGRAGLEVAEGEHLERGDGGLDLRRLFRLAVGEIGGFEAARVVFAFGAALLVRGFGARGERGLEIDF